MKLLGCSIYDDAVKAFMPPLWYRSRGEAVRSFLDAFAAEKSQFTPHAGDYAMYALGEFDDQSGSFAAFATPEKLLGGLEAREVVSRV